MDTVGRDEADALRAAARGDADAFGLLVEQYQEVAFRAAYLIVRDAQDAQDVAQDAFVRAYHGLDGFRQGEPFRPWLLRIVQHTALNAVRSRGRRAGLLGRFAAVAPRAIDPPDAVVLAAGEAAEVLAAINELPPDDRAILHLRYFLEVTRAIAETLP